MIRIENLRKTYRMGEVEVLALRGVSLTVEQGEFIAIMGASGSGKSTLMHVMGLLDTPTGGSYQLLGREVSTLGEDELSALRGRAIGFVFQQFHLLARTTALENVALPRLYVAPPADSPPPEKLLEEVGLGDRAHHKPNQLSGGQQQRVAIARALANQPPILLADEPTGNLDSKSSAEIMELLDRLNARGITVVLVTHEEDIARHARRVIRMRDGLVQSDERLKSVPASAAPAPEILLPQANASGAISFAEAAAFFRQALRALLANKVRSGLSMLGILIGVAAVIAMLALGAGARESIQSQLASMGSNLLVLRSGSRQMRGVALEAGAVTRMTLEDAQSIERDLAHIRRVAPTVTGRGQIVFGNKNWNTQVLGTTPPYALMRSAVPTVGRFFTEEELAGRARVAVLGLTVARELFGDANPAGESIKINRVSFQVIGVMPEKGSTTWRDQDDVIAIPLTTAMRRLLGKDYVDTIDIEVSDAEAIAETQEAVEQLVIKRHRLPPSQQESFEVRNMAEMQAAMSESSRTMSWLLASIAAVSLVVGGIGIMNIMLVSVTERTREIGLRKALGARRRDILAQFLIEAVVVSVAGGIAGIVLGSVITLSISQFAGWSVALSPVAVLLAFLFSAGIGITFGLWPAQQASRLDPITALRYE